MRVLASALLGLCLLGSPAFAQGAPAGKPAPQAAKKPGGGPPASAGPQGSGPRGGMMGRGMMDEEGCDGDDCPMMGGGMMGGGMMGGGMGGGMGLGKLEHMADELGLSDAARKSIRDAIYEAGKQSITLRAELAQAQLELHRMLEQDKPNLDAVLKQVEKVGQARTELMKLHVRTMLGIEQQLTPDQRKKLRNHVRSMHKF